MGRASDWSSRRCSHGNGRFIYGRLSGSSFPHARRRSRIFEFASFGIAAGKIIGKASGMREAVMSCGLFVAGKAESECVRPQEVSSKPAWGWNPQDFAREQVRGLVRQLFLSSERTVRQVVFSPIEAETDVLNLCWRVGETLALETKQG